MSCTKLVQLACFGKFMRFFALRTALFGGFCCLRLGRLPKPVNHSRRKNGTNFRPARKETEVLFRFLASAELENNLRKTSKKICH